MVSLGLEGEIFELVEGLGRGVKVGSGGWGTWEVDCGWNEWLVK